MNQSDDFNLNQLLLIFSKQWRYFLVVSLACLLGAMIKHKYFPQYPGSGKLIIKDIRNSQLQSVIGHLTGLDGEPLVAENRGDDIVSNAEAMLDIHEFYVLIAENLIKLNKQSNYPAIAGFFKTFSTDSSSPEFVHEVAIKLSKMITFNSGKANVLTVEVKSDFRELTVLLVNQTLVLAKRKIISKELEDLNQAEIFFLHEVEKERTELNSIEMVTLEKMQKNQIFSIDQEKGDSIQNINDLKKNINEINIQITNNQSKIIQLQKNEPFANYKVINLSKFDHAYQIKTLVDENKELALKLSTFNSYLKNFVTQKKYQAPLHFELEKMNSNHDFVYKVIASYKDSLARIGLQKTYVLNKVEILEYERFSRVHSNPTLLIFILLSLTLAFSFSVFSIYVFELFKPTDFNNFS